MLKIILSFGLMNIGDFCDKEQYAIASGILSCDYITYLQATALSPVGAECGGTSDLSSDVLRSHYWYTPQSWTPLAPDTWMYQVMRPCHDTPVSVSDVGYLVGRHCQYQLSGCDITQTAFCWQSNFLGCIPVIRNKLPNDCFSGMLTFRPLTT